LPWFKTGTEGHGHEKAWYYWLWLISRYEWPALGGLLLCLFAWQFKSVYLRYLAIYGVGTLIAYSIVKYKTPWCIISFIWPFLFTFGALVTIARVRLTRTLCLWLGLAVFALLAFAFIYAQNSNFDYNWPYILIVGGGLIVLAVGSEMLSHVLMLSALCVSFGYAIWLNYFRCTTDSEPYVYVQTYNDIFKFTGPILRLAHSDPRAYQLVGHIIRPSPYPLPWMLGDFGRVGYYEKDNMPDNVDGDFLLVAQDKIKTVESKLHDLYYTVPVTIRPYQDPSKAYFSVKVFKALFPGRAPDFTGAKPTPHPTVAPSPVASASPSTTQTATGTPK
jgi:hypothetical protein